MKRKFVILNLLVILSAVKKIVCHPERSEGSDYTDVGVQILRFAQDDNEVRFSHSTFIQR
jgi:hypothetical protein